MTFSRSSGVLLHPTSLPGKYGNGDLGPSIYRFIDFLADSGCSLWQVLPLGPTGYGDSPYQNFSAFAGNPYLVSPELLLIDGLLTDDDLRDMPSFDNERVDYGLIFSWKPGLLDRAFDRFTTTGSIQIRNEFEAYCFDEAYWLDDFALFMALKDFNKGISWNSWPIEQRTRNQQAMDSAKITFSTQILQQKFRQFLFSRQWNSLKKYVNG
ncbi:MAG: 4-alpha-glucanotransferase, partial [Chloroflexota bacterium]